MHRNFINVQKNQKVSVEHTMVPVSHQWRKTDKWSLEYPWHLMKLRTNNADLQNEELDETNVENVEDCLVLFSLFQEPTYEVFISLRVDDIALRTVANLLHTGTNPTLATCLYLLASSQAQDKPAKPPALGTETREKVLLQCLVLLHTHVGNIHAGRWLGVFEKLVVYLFLGTSFIDRYICVFYPKKWKIIPVQSHPMTVLTDLLNVVWLVLETSEMTHRWKIREADASSIREARSKIIKPHMHCWCSVRYLAANQSLISSHGIVVKTNY